MWWYVDNTLVKTQSVSASNMEEYRQSFFVILNLALAGSFPNTTNTLSDATPRLPSVIVPAKGVRVFWADGRPELGSTHLAFKLSASAGRVLFYGPDGALLDRFDWKKVATDVAWARFPDGEGGFVQCAVATCRALNGPRCLE